MARSSSLGAEAGRGFRDLKVYQRAMNAVVEVHRRAAALPDFERYELGAQMRRASKSVPANIAEGYGRKRSTRDFMNFLTMAMASANEMEVHLEIAKRLGYLAEAESAQLIDEYNHIGRQLSSLISYWRRGGNHERRVTSNE